MRLASLIFSLLFFAATVRGEVVSSICDHIQFGSTGHTICNANNAHRNATECPIVVQQGRNNQMNCRQYCRQQQVDGEPMICHHASSSCTSSQSFPCWYDFRVSSTHTCWCQIPDWVPPTTPTGSSTTQSSTSTASPRVPPGASAAPVAATIATPAPAIAPSPPTSLCSRLAPPPPDTVYLTSLSSAAQCAIRILGHSDNEYSWQDCNQVCRDFRNSDGVQLHCERGGLLALRHLPGINIRSDYPCGHNFDEDEGDDPYFCKCRNPTGWIAPTAAPTQIPSDSPTAIPTVAPSRSPSTSPTAIPTATPSPIPNGSPTAMPAAILRGETTRAPSRVPTVRGMGTPTQDTTAAFSTTASRTLNPSHGVGRALSSLSPTPLPTPMPVNNGTASPSAALGSTGQSRAEPSSKIGLIVGLLAACLLVLVLAALFYRRSKFSKSMVKRPLSKGLTLDMCSNPLYVNGKDTGHAVPQQSSIPGEAAQQRVSSDHPGGSLVRASTEYFVAQDDLPHMYATSVHRHSGSNVIKNAALPLSENGLPSTNTASNEYCALAAPGQYAAVPANPNADEYASLDRAAPRRLSANLEAPGPGFLHFAVPLEGTSSSVVVLGTSAVHDTES